MRRTAFSLISVSLGLLLLGAPVAGQLRVTPIVGGHGIVGLGLVLRKLNTVGTLMMATAHPDDENSGLLVRAGQGEGLRTALVTATRGSGGQNEIGPELFDALSVLRTEELGAVHRFDGAEQYFTRAVDFGYSFSREETLQRWGHREILGDFVRLIRTIRPDVITAMSTAGTGGGLHHQTSAQLVEEAFAAAADPAQYPGQIAAGLRPWQPKKLYFMTQYFGAAPGPGPTIDVDLSHFDPLLGRTYAEVGSEARSMHKCQGTPQLLALPGPAATQYKLMACALPGGLTRADAGLFDGIDTSILGLAGYAGADPPAPLRAGLAEISGQAATALTAFEQGGSQSAAPAIFAGLSAVRRLRTAMASLGLDDTARFEIDSRLAREARLFEQAAELAYGLRVEALADDGVVVAGQPVKLSFLVSNHGPVGVGVREVAIEGFDGLDGASRCTPGAAQPDRVYSCAIGATVPADAPPTTIYWTRQAGVDRYAFAPGVPFGVPFAPTPFRARFTIDFPEGEVVVERPIQYRYQRDIFAGEKRMELNVVPAVSVTAEPAVAIVPAGAVAAGAAGATREVRVTVVNGAKGAASADVSLDAPAGWTVSPQSAPVRFTREDEAETVRFAVTPSRGTRPGRYAVTAAAREGDAVFREGYQAIEYPHIHRRQIVRPSTIEMTVADVTPPRPMTVGYVMGSGDEGPEAIEQLGVQVVRLDRDALAFGDLSRYGAIVTGVRAYERRDDLRAHNRRLLEYVRQGGTLIVQYERASFNRAQYGPYPAKVGSGRVTDETAPVEVLEPDNPIFATPNRIGAETWAGWVQERGLSFLTDLDPHYHDLVRMTDPFPFNAGPKTGALVEADYGRGHWIYVGLGLWRQFRAGTPGAYRLLANLLSVR
jgi:LmbE family N-acetylglucosaminyl deacetylase